MTAPVEGSAPSPPRVAVIVPTLREVENLPELVARVGAVRAELGGDHAGNWQKLHELADRERELDALLARRMTEWEAAGVALAKARESA